MTKVSDSLYCEPLYSVPRLVSFMGTLSVNSATMSEATHSLCTHCLSADLHTLKASLGGKYAELGNAAVWFVWYLRALQAFPPGSTFSPTKFECIIVTGFGF